MNHWLSFLPDRASTMSHRVDLLLLFELGVSAFFAILIFALVVAFALKYRRRPDNQVATQIEGNLQFELAWTFIPLLLTLVMFGWGAKIFFDMKTPPANAMEIQVVAKQWMWKVQQPTGQREINAIHVPVGQPVQLIMTSEDVIHSLFVPAFSVKQDVLPGRYTRLWFTATEPGTYHLFCSQYCGAQHSGMIGWVYAMEPAEYAAWLNGGGNTAATTPIDRGHALFQRLGCVTCHVQAAPQRCPSLAGIFGKPVKLASGESVIADEEYIRQAIIKPNSRPLAGYQPVMPTYTGQVTEEDVLNLIAYIKSLTPPAEEASK
jgi:cytochrome c oxidase subunit 2